jgi:hypothetical protein
MASATARFMTFATGSNVKFLISETHNTPFDPDPEKGNSIKVRIQNFQVLRRNDTET